MATQKKGCGLLITALVLLLLGGVIATMLGMGMVSSGKEFLEKIEETGKSFSTPESLTFSPEEDSEVTVWFAGNGKQESAKTDQIVIEVTDTSTNSTTTAVKPEGSSGSFGNQHLVATFTAKKGSSYEITASGIEDGRTFRIASISTEELFKIAGKGLGVMAALAVFGLPALIFGIIGLVKFFGSPNAPPLPPPAA